MIYNRVSEISIEEFTLIGTRINGKEWDNLPVLKVNINIPADYKLEQNYPNPFNPTTTIEFAIIKSSRVKITCL